MLIGIDASRANTKNRTGTEWYSFFIIRELLELDRQNKYILYVQEPLVSDMRDLSAQANIRILGWPPRFLWSLIRLSIEMLFRPPDVLFVPAHTIPLIHPKRTVTTCHDVGFERFPELYATKSIGPGSTARRIFGLIIKLLTLGRYSNTELDYHRFSMRWAIRTAARILTVSRFSAREISKYYGYPESNIKVTPISFNPEYLKSITDEKVSAVLAELGIRPPYGLFVGRFEAKKNIGLILSAFEKARLCGYRQQLVLVGRAGWGFPKAWSNLDLKTREQISILPPQPVERLQALMRGAGVFLFPSAYEGFGIPVLEAMASGVPVVASNRASLPEVCGEAALFIDPDKPDELVKAMIRLAGNEALRRELINKGYQRIKNFSWDKTAAQTLPSLTDW